MNKSVFAFIIAVVVSPNLWAQDVQVNLQTDSTQILIGDWFTAKLTVEAPQDFEIVFPVSDAEFSNGAYVSSDSAEQTTSAGTVLYTKKYTLTSFDTGAVDLSANVTYYRPGDTTAYVATSNELMLDVVTVRIDTAGTFRDIKDVLDVPYTWWEYVLFISGILAIFSLLWFAWYRWKYRPEKEELVEEPEPEPVIPAEILALEKLRSLEEKKLWEQDKHKEYQSELSETVREYIEGKFKVPALEETTPEIIKHVSLKGVDPKLIAELELALQCADLTKFAKYKPDPVAHRQGLKTAYLFVEETKYYVDSIEEAAAVKPSVDLPAEEPRPGEPLPVNEGLSDERRDSDVQS